MACIFCKIIERQAAASIVYEDEHFVAFMDLFPMRPGHTLIIPKAHHGFVSELSSATRAGLFELGHRVLMAHKQVFPEVGGHNLIINDGPIANQHVPHVHLHVIPRCPGDLPKAVYSLASRYLNHFGMEARRRELDDMAAKLRAALASSGQ